MTEPTSDQVSEYGRAAVAALPTGPVWPRDRTSNLSRLLESFGVEFSRLGVRGQDLLRESDPHQTLELLAEWERAYGLPSPCTGQLETLEERRSALVARRNGRGGQSIPYLVELAALLGYDVEVVEHLPFQAGRSTAGDPLTNGQQPFQAGRARCGDALTNRNWWPYYADVIAPQVTVRTFQAGRSGAGEPLAVWQNTLLECTLRSVSPAHVVLRFLYENQATEDVQVSVVTVLRDPIIALFFDLDAFDMLTTPHQVLTQEFDEAGGRWSLAASSTAFVALPGAFVSSELLRNGGVLAWHVSGTYTNTTGAPIDVELALYRDADVTPFASFVMEGVPASPDSTLTGHFWLDVRLAVRSTVQGRLRYDATFNPKVTQQGTAASGHAASTTFRDVNRIWGTTDWNADQLIVPKLRKVTSSAATLAVLEISAVAPVIRSGAGVEG